MRRRIRERPRTAATGTHEDEEDKEAAIDGRDKDTEGTREEKERPCMAATGTRGGRDEGTTRGDFGGSGGKMRGKLEKSGGGIWK